MHELAVAEAILDAVTAKVRPRTVARVSLRVGALAGVMPDALRFCFELCAQGTLLDGAVLEIDESEGEELLIKEVEVH